MDESMETFVPLKFRRRGVQRVAAELHDLAGHGHAPHLPNGNGPRRRRGGHVHGQARLDGDAHLADGHRRGLAHAELVVVAELGAEAERGQRAAISPAGKRAIVWDEPDGSVFVSTSADGAMPRESHADVGSAPAAAKPALRRRQASHRPQAAPSSAA